MSTCGSRRLPLSTEEGLRTVPSCGSTLNAVEASGLHPCPHPGPPPCPIHVTLVRK